MATVVSDGVKTVQFTSGGTKIKMYLALTNYPRGNTNYIWAQMYIDSSTSVGSYSFYSADKKPVTVTVNGVSHTINCMWAIAGSSDRDWHINASASYNGASGTGCLITKNNKWEQWFAVDNNADGSAKTVNWSWSFGKSNTSGSSGGSTITDSGTWTTTATKYTVTCQPNGGSGSNKTVNIGLDNSGTLPAAITRSNSSETVTGYKVSFNKNNGATTPDPITSTRTKTTPWNFGGWNTNTSGTGTNYSAGGSYSRGYNQNILTATNHYNGTSDAYNAHNTTGFVGNSGGNGTLGSRTTDKPTSGDGYGNITTVFTVTSNTSGNRDFAQKNIPFISGQQYTLSWWEKGSGNNLIRSWNSTDSKEVLWQNTSMPSAWTRKTYTFTATSEMWEDNCSVCIGCTGSATGAWAGIKLEKGASATAYTPNYNDTSGVTLYAKWTAGTITYTNHAITLPAAITRADSSANTTLTTSFNVNGGSSAAPAALTSTKTVVTKYDFNGWHEGSASGTSHGASTSFTPSAAITMYAGWNSSTKSTTYTNITLPAAPTRTGYTFAGWYSASSGGTKAGNAGASYQPTANGTLYAHWTPITYTISWNLDGGTLPNGTNYIYDSGNYTYIQCPTSMPYDNSAYTVNEGKSRNSYFSVGTPTKVGYTFTGWVITGMDSTTHYFWYDGAGQSTTATTFDTRTISTKSPLAQRLRATAGTVTWTAQWTPATYTITFNPNGGTVSSTTKTVTYGTSYTDLPKATRPGCKFKGWFINCAGAASTAVAFGQAYKYTPTLNIHFVTYSEDYSTWSSQRIISCTQGGGWNIENRSGKPGFIAYNSSTAAYSYCNANITWASLTPGFHTWDAIISNKVMTLYIDGVSRGTQTMTDAAIGYHATNGIFVGAEAATTDTTPVSPYLTGYVGNVVIGNSATRITDLGRQRFTAPGQNVTLYALWEPYFNVYIKGKTSGWVLLKDGHDWAN